MADIRSKVSSKELSKSEDKVLAIADTAAMLRPITTDVLDKPAERKAMEELNAFFSNGTFFVKDAPLVTTSPKAFPGNNALNTLKVVTTSNSVAMVLVTPSVTPCPLPEKALIAPATEEVMMPVKIALGAPNPLAAVTAPAAAPNSKEAPTPEEPVTPFCARNTSRKELAACVPQSTTPFNPSIKGPDKSEARTDTIATKLLADFSKDSSWVFAPAAAEPVRPMASVFLTNCSLLATKALITLVALTSNTLSKSSAPDPCIPNFSSSFRTLRRGLLLPLKPENKLDIACLERVSPIDSYLACSTLSVLASGLKSSNRPCLNPVDMVLSLIPTFLSVAAAPRTWSRFKLKDLAVWANLLNIVCRPVAVSLEVLTALVNLSEISSGSKSLYTFLSVLIMSAATVRLALVAAAKLAVADKVAAISEGPVPAWASTCAEAAISSVVNCVVVATFFTAFSTAIISSVVARVIALILVKASSNPVTFSAKVPKALLIPPKTLKAIANLIKVLKELANSSIVLVGPLSSLSNFFAVTLSFLIRFSRSVVLWLAALVAITCLSNEAIVPKTAALSPFKAPTISADVPVFLLVLVLDSAAASFSYEEVTCFMEASKSFKALASASLALKTGLPFFALCALALSLIFSNSISLAKSLSLEMPSETPFVEALFLFASILVKAISLRKLAKRSLA